MWRAEDTLLGRAVALKVLDQGLARDPRDRRRFLNEARTHAALDHPAIPAVLDHGEQGDTVYIAFALIDGDTIAELAARGLLPPDEVVRIGIAAAEALAHAHGQGVVHRDVTARNLMRARDGRVFVLDFGLARAAGQSRHTTSGVTLGTVAYLAPEVARGGEATPQSDLYGLGVVLYEAVAGEPPFRGAVAEAVLYGAANLPPPPLRERRPDAPAALEALILQLLAKGPGERPSDAHAVAMALRAIATTSGATAAGERREDPPLPASARMPERLFVAVLPFEELEGEAGERTHPGPSASGFATSLRAALARASGIQVVAVPDASDGGAEPDAALARRLGANLLVRGTLRRSGRRLRVTWTAVEPRAGLQLAADVLDGTTDDPLDLEDRLAASVARALDAGGAGPARRAARDPAARERYLQAVGSLQRYDNEAAVDGAIARLERLVESGDGGAAVHAALARAFLQKLRLTHEPAWHARAASQCERALGLDPEAPEVRLALGEVHLTTGRHAEALEAFRASHARQPSPDALVGIARACDALGRDAEAEATFRDAIERHPRHWPAHSWYGVFLFRRTRYAEAIEAWTRVTEHTPDNARAHYNLAAAYLQMDRYDDAVAACERSLAIQPTMRAYTNLGTANFYLGRLDAALDAHRRAAALAPDDARTWTNIGSVALHVPGHDALATEAFDRAIALLRARLERDPQDADDWAYLAIALGNRRDHRGAIEAITHALERAPGDANVMMIAGSVCNDAGEREQALHWIEAAVRHGLAVGRLLHSPGLATLRDDPGFRRIVERSPTTQEDS